jgi:hypothetical protein
MKYRERTQFRTADSGDPLFQDDYSRPLLRQVHRRRGQKCPGGPGRRVEGAQFTCLVTGPGPLAWAALDEQTGGCTDHSDLESALAPRPILEMRLCSTSSSGRPSRATSQHEHKAALHDRSAASFRVISSQDYARCSAWKTVSRLLLAQLSTGACGVHRPRTSGQGNQDPRTRRQAPRSRQATLQ